MAGVGGQSERHNRRAHLRRVYGNAHGSHAAGRPRSGGWSQRAIGWLAARDPTRGVQYLRRLWGRLTPGQRHVTANLVIGLALAAAVTSLHERRPLRDIEDAAFDWMLVMYRGTAPVVHSAPPFALLDIDETSYRAWGEPLHIPRDRLVRLVEYAVGGEPAAVIVDIDLSRSVGAEDRELVQYLEAYSDSRPADRRRPPLILQRRLRHPVSPDGSAYLEQAPSFLDGIVAQSPDIHWAAALFELALM